MNKLKLIKTIIAIIFLSTTTQAKDLIGFLAYDSNGEIILFDSTNIDRFSKVDVYLNYQVKFVIDCSDDDAPYMVVSYSRKDTFETWNLIEAINYCMTNIKRP